MFLYLVAPDCKYVLLMLRGFTTVSFMVWDNKNNIYNYNSLNVLSSNETLLVTLHLTFNILRLQAGI